MENGSVYIIKNTVNDKVYVGITTQRLNRRLNEHRSRLNTGSLKPFYERLRADGIASSDLFIELLEGGLRKDELKVKEVEYMDAYQSYSSGYNYHKGHGLDLPEEEIYLLYESGVTLREIGKKFGVDKDAIKLRVERQGGTIRDWNQKQRINELNSKELLTRLYVSEMMTTPEIAALYNTSSVTVLKWMKKHDIPSRPAVNRMYL